MTSQNSTRRITCPECHTGLTLKQHARPARKMRCPKCRTVFVAGEDQEPVARPRQKPSPAAGRNAPEISWRWNNLVAGNGFGPIILIGLMSVVTLVMLSTAIKDSRIGVRIFCLTASLPAALIVYRVVISCFNRTTMRLDGETLCFQTQPCPWFGRSPVSLAGAKRVATVKEFIHGTRFKGEHKQLYHYNVVAEFGDGRQQTIVKCSANRKLANRIQEFLTSNMVDVEFTGIKPDIHSIDPGAKSRVLTELNDESNEFAVIHTTAAEQEWEIDSVGGVWTAVRRWYSPISGIVLIVLCGGPVIAIPAMMLAAAKDQSVGLEIWLAIAVGGIAFVGGAYTGIALLVNRTEITWDTDALSMRHVPLPWSAPGPIATNQIAGFEVERTIRSGAGSNSYREVTDPDSPFRSRKLKSTRRYLYDYRLLVRLVDGSTVKHNKTGSVERVAALQKILTRQLLAFGGERKTRRRK